MLIRKKRLITASILLLSACIAAGGLLYLGVIQFNNPSHESFPVRGVDVSSYQGEIEWETLAGQGIQFAFIKATEGSTFQDRYFKANAAGAAETNLRIGAYHFFSLESPGAEQALNFIEIVDKASDMLPPVVDFEVNSEAYSRADIQSELSILLAKLEEHYNMKPIIYVTEKSYKLYISGNYHDYDIWVRNVTGKPRLCDGREWAFWQYTNRERLHGYHGEERFIDMNVFNGTYDQFMLYGNQPASEPHQPEIPLTDGRTHNHDKA